MAINTNMSISPIRTATRRLTYFFRRGNKEGRESRLRQLFQRRAVAKQSVSGTNLTSSDLFQSFFISATPFIGLKTRRRRRGKRVIVKLAPLERDRGERRSFIALSNTLQISGAASKPFVDRLERELEVLAAKATPGASKLKTQVGVSAIRDKRNEIHKLAYFSRPYR